MGVRWNLIVVFLTCLFIYLYVHTCLGHLSHYPLFPPSSPTPLTSRQNLFCPLLQYCWRENIRDNKKDIIFLLAWNKDSYTERFLALLPCTCVLHPKLVRLYQTSSLLPSRLPIVASVSLTLLYSLPYSGHIKHIQVLGFLCFPVPPVRVLSLVCDPCPIILLH
jgi:hypothetical protein